MAMAKGTVLIGSVKYLRKHRAEAVKVPPQARRRPVRSHNRSAPESLSIPLLRAIDQRRKVARIRTKNQPRTGQ